MGVKIRGEDGRSTGGIKVRETQSTNTVARTPTTSVSAGVRQREGLPVAPATRARQGIAGRGRGYVPEPVKTTGFEVLHPLLADTASYPVQVSVVLGTHNRLALLQRCIASIRNACRHQTYEIVVGVGASSDGTEAWLAQQHDVVVVDGGLSGAVQAFNAAWAASKGRFVVALNDDAELYDDTIDNGLRHFADPLVGQISMNFLEHGKWKHERIWGTTPYANFSITRANLLRAIASICGGMWATIYLTYGGDTELSCWVHRLGYKVVEATDARVRHDEHRDGLRDRNTRNDTARQEFFRRWALERIVFRGASPKVAPGELTALRRIEFGELPSERWSRIAAADPVVGRLPPNLIPSRERVLHVQLWTEDDPQTSMVAGLRSMGSAGHHVVPWTRYATQDERDRALVEATAQLRPTVVFLQLQGAGAISPAALKQLRSGQHDPSMVIALWSGDVGPTNGPWAGLQDGWAYEMAPHADLMLFTGTGQVAMHRARGMTNAAYLQIGYDEDRYFPRGDGDPNRAIDLLFLGQNYGAQYDGLPGSEAQLRRDVVGALRGLPRVEIFGGGWGMQTLGVAQHQTGDLYRNAHLAVSISLTSSLARYTSDRLFRSLACGTPTLVKRFEDQAGLGLVEDVNCIGFDTPSELVTKARYWLASENRERLHAIGSAGASLAQAHHTWGVRMQELAALLAAVRGQPR